MSVVAQQIDYVNTAMRVLNSSGDNQYGIRGQPKFDKVFFAVPLFAFICRFCHTNIFG